MKVPFAEAVKKSVPNVLVGAVGLIFSPQQAEDILQHHQADIVYFAREFLRYNNNFIHFLYLLFSLLFY